LVPLSLSPLNSRIAILLTVTSALRISPCIRFFPPGSFIQIDEEKNKVARDRGGRNTNAPSILWKLATGTLAAGAACERMT